MPGNFVGVLFVLLVLCLDCASVLAVDVASLDVTRQWKVQAIEFTGNDKFPESDLMEAITTKERPWYQFWSDRPTFDPVGFAADLERLRRFYEARGYYEAKISHDLDANQESGLVTAHIHIQEGAPVVVSDINVAVTGSAESRAAAPLPEKLPVQRDDVFQEQKYQESEETLRNYFLDSGYAHVETTRRADLDLERNRAHLEYSIRPGPVTFFGHTEVTGLNRVDPDVVLRELSYRPGERFSAQKVAESRAKILALNLFSIVRISPKKEAGNSPIVPMEINVTEKSFREFRIGVGYGTEDNFRTQAEWRHSNWLGDGRQLSIQARYSSIILGGSLELMQPHLFSPRNKGFVIFKHDREDEETFLRNVSRFTPRVEHLFSPSLTGFLGYRVEYDSLSEIASATEQALGGVRKQGLLSGPTMGFVWNTTKDPFAPKQGEIVSFAVDQAGAPWGGRFQFYKITAEAKKFLDIGWETVLAGRLKLGAAQPIGEDRNFPIFERFFAGGDKSVRGYGRRRLGPLSAANDPIGGLSLIEGSVELRRPIWQALGGALFLDFGQVSLRSFDFPVDDLKFAAGFGVSYSTPVGPIRLDIGFPFKPPRGDASWRIHFSVGAVF